MGYKGGHSARINKTLISLKVVVFLVISGLTALHILHATKPLLLGLKFSEYNKISILAPFVSILGPLIAGPWADHLAAKNPNGFGRTLRVLTALFLLLSTAIFSCLFLIPNVARQTPQTPEVSFGCDGNGAYIFQKLCDSNGTCYNWEQKTGNVKLTNCTYSCLNPNSYENMYHSWVGELPTAAPSTEQSSEFDYEEDPGSATTETIRAKRQNDWIDSSADSAGVELMSTEINRSKRQVKDTNTKVYVEPPHLCIIKKGQAEKQVQKCHVYTQDTPSITLDAVMGAAMTGPKSNETVGWCQYPLEGIQCNIPHEQEIYMMKQRKHTNCKPIIECMVIDPYDGKDSVLADSECVKTTGNVEDTLVGYAVIRLLGDIFAMAALTLLNTAIVIAVRETSEGRGEVCRQYVWGAIGYVILFSPLDLFFIEEQQINKDAVVVALIIFIVSFALGAVVLLCASQMPLSPPEWWWHTKTGMLVVPMSAVRRYSPEIIVLTLVTILFGTFWSSIHSFLFWTFKDDIAICYSGIILVLVLFFNIDKFIEYCGHSNIFIAGFAIFVVRFTALSDTQLNWLTVVMETIEPAAIGLIWITIILYMRHTMPRKLTATGQAIAVLAFFGLGKGFGALIGLARDEKNLKLESWKSSYQCLAMIACIVALVYLLVYNLILTPHCTAKPQHTEELISGSASHNFGDAATNGNTAGNGTGVGANASLNGNTNGSYSPLRVYHNERGKKGQFRY